MRVQISTTFACPPERIWHEVRKTQLLRYIAYPLQVFEPITPSVLPTEWEEGDYLVKLKAFGALPLGEHHIRITFPEINSTRNPSRFQVRDDGGGKLVPTWDHLITIEGEAGGGTRYTDRVEVGAGLLTPLIWLYANVFYRYRQWRWHQLIKRHFVYT